MKSFYIWIALIALMALMAFSLGSLIGASQAKASDYSDVRALANKNGYSPSNDVVRAIVKASRWYNISPLDLTAIGILETGLGKYSLVNTNKRGSVDHGIFQINDINVSKCNMFDLNSVEGNALCAGLLLHDIRRTYSNKDTKWIGIYNSKTLKYKEKYFAKISKILNN